jgi:hypothetical protein
MVFLNDFNELISKIKKYHFNIFLIKKYNGLVKYCYFFFFQIFWFILKNALKFISFSISVLAQVHSSSLTSSPSFILPIIFLSDRYNYT